MDVKELKDRINIFNASFGAVLERWSLPILYTLFLGERLSFNSLKAVLGVNSRTLSDRLRLLEDNGFLVRCVDAGPPVRVFYVLSDRGRDLIVKFKF